MRFLTTLIASLTFVASGCANTTPNKSSDERQTLNPYSLCEVREHQEELFGKTIRIRAIYVTDTFTFSDLRDASCRGGTIGYVVLNKEMYASSDETLRNMINYQNKQCAGSVMCSFTAKIDAEIILTMDSASNRVGAVIKHVYSITRE